MNMKQFLWAWIILIIAMGIFDVFACYCNWGTFYGGLSLGFALLMFFSAITLYYIMKIQEVMAETNDLIELETTEE